MSQKPREALIDLRLNFERPLTRSKRERSHGLTQQVLWTVSLRLGTEGLKVAFIRIKDMTTDQEWSL